MSWWSIGIGTALGVKKGVDNQARMEKNDKFRKASIQYSPWTKMGDPGSPELAGPLASGAEGAAMGALVGKGFGKAAPVDTTTIAGTTTGSAGALNASTATGGVDASLPIGAQMSQMSPAQMNPIMSQMSPAQMNPSAAPMSSPMGAAPQAQQPGMGQPGAWGDSEMNPAYPDYGTDTVKYPKWMMNNKKNMGY